MQIDIAPEDLKPIVAQILAEIADKLSVDDGRLAYSEVEVAAKLGVTRVVLRDERRRGRIKASKVGRKIRYTRGQILEYLDSRTWTNRGGQ